MPEYRAPGVYVEETSFRSRSIEGVGTSTAAIVGPTSDGPVSGIPRVMTSFIEFERTYGPTKSLKYGSGASEVTVVNDTALAVRAFFENGGKQMFVSRAVADNAVKAGLGSGFDDIAIAARYPGSGSNYKLEINWHGSVTVPVGPGPAPASDTTSFDLEIRRGNSLLASVNDISIDKTKTNFVANKLHDDAGLPVIFTLVDNAATTDDIRAELIQACDDTMKQPAAIPQRFEIALKAGVNGTRPDANAYRGAEAVSGKPSGLVAFEYVEDISTVLAPAASRLADDTLKAIVNHMLAHCHKMRYRLALVDGKESHDLTQIQTFRSNFSDDRLVLYYPWIVGSAPEGGTVNLPASGFMAGVYARNDVERGVHKAPANTVPFGALRFSRSINAFQQELLNPKGINCLRSFSTRGHRVWGARTLGGDPNWKYVNIRRYFLYLERSIELSTQWAVFEPNGTLLWDSVRESIEDFLYTEWINGRLLGGDPKQAYFVRCDRTTMTQNDIDNGRLVCLIGVAPLTPAEFVVFRIGQKTIDA